MTSVRDARSGVFITFEGIEGSGKTTQCARLAKRLREEGYRVVETREPGGTPLAERIRELLLNPPVAEAIVPECEAFLILAARSQHVAHEIAPALQEGAVVLCDRFADSTLAYQGYARGLDPRRLESLNRIATRGLAPHLTLLFDLPVQAGLARRRRQGLEHNRLDWETREFHERVRKGFLTLSKRHARRIKVLNARQDPDRLAVQVASLVTRLLDRHAVPRRHRP